VTANDRKLELDLPAAHSEVVVARRSLRIFCRMAGINGRGLDDLLLVASELLGNAVDHGGGQAAMRPEDARTRMRLELSVRPGHWSLAVSDQGGGDAEELRAMVSGELEPDLEDERGRGFWLLAQMTDGLVVDPSEDGSGLRVSVSRVIETAPADGSRDPLEGNILGD